MATQLGEKTLETKRGKIYENDTNVMKINESIHQYLKLSYR
jgi:hypothetical protein